MATAAASQDLVMTHDIVPGHDSVVSPGRIKRVTSRKTFLSRAPLSVVVRDLSLTRARSLTWRPVTVYGATLTALLALVISHLYVLRAG
jgi:hypothetical protein